jgi:hypothetical protein
VASEVTTQSAERYKRACELIPGVSPHRAALWVEGPEMRECKQSATRYHTTGHHSGPADRVRTTPKRFHLLGLMRGLTSFDSAPSLMAYTGRRLAGTVRWIACRAVRG